MNKIIIAIGVLLSSNAFALRCGTHLIEIGDMVSKVEQYCQISGVYGVNNSFADIQIISVADGGGTSRIKVIDGVVQSIDFTRGGV